MSRSKLLRSKGHSNFLALVCLAALLACDQTSPGDSTDQGCDVATTGDARDTVAPIAIDCSFSFGGVQHDASLVPSDGEDEELVELEIVDLRADLNLYDSEYSGRSFSVTIYKDDASVLSTAIYQMPRNRLPVNEFQGQHGFTGLNWVKDPAAGMNVQYACFARDPSDPAISWDE